MRKYTGEIFCAANAGDIVNQSSCGCDKVILRRFFVTRATLVIVIVIIIKK